MGTKVPMERSEKGLGPSEQTTGHRPQRTEGSDTAKDHVGCRQPQKPLSSSVHGKEPLLSRHGEKKA